MTWMRFWNIGQRGPTQIIGYHLSDETSLGPLNLLPPPLIHRGRAAGGQILWGCINDPAMDHAVLCSPNVFSALAYVPNVPLLHMTLAALGHYVAAPAWMYHAADGDAIDFFVGIAII